MDLKARYVITLCKGLNPNVGGSEVASLCTYKNQTCILLDVDLKCDLLLKYN